MPGEVQTEVEEPPKAYTASEAKAALKRKRESLMGALATQALLAPMYSYTWWVATCAARQDEHKG